MKKSYFRKSWPCFLLAIIIAFPALGAIALIIFEKLTIFEYVICGCGIIIFGLALIEMFKYRIILYDTYIYVGKDKNIMLLNIQHETHIEFNHIKDMKIEHSTTDSKGLIVKGLRLKKSPNTYLTFILHNGKQERISINFYSKKRVLSMAQEIATRCNIELSKNFIDDINKLIRF